MFYIATTGCQWRQLPRDFPPYSTVQSYFYRWVEDGRWQIINHALVVAAREKAGREPSPTAAPRIRPGHAAACRRQSESADPVQHAGTAGSIFGVLGLG
jgi:transposase